MMNDHHAETKSEWRAGITKKDIVNELDAKLQIRV